jgi:hypothetical protein
LGSSTNGRDFDLMVMPWGTAPNGHFDVALKTAGTARARNGHRMGTKQNAALFGAAHIQF